MAAIPILSPLLKVITKTMSGDDALRVIVAELIGEVTGDFSPTGLKNGGEIFILPVDNTGWVEVTKSGLTTPSGTGLIDPLNQVNVYNPGGSPILVQHADPNDATFPQASVNYGVPIVAGGGERRYQITAGIPLYLRSTGSGTIDVIIETLG